MVNNEHTKHKFMLIMISCNDATYKHRANDMGKAIWANSHLGFD